MKPTESTGFDARQWVDHALDHALVTGASDLHVEPTSTGYEVRLRIDGLLQPSQSLDTTSGRSIVGRLMVLASLLTYRTDIPQEGRAMHIRPNTSGGGSGSTVTSGGGGAELRVSIMPTRHGLRAVVRLPSGQSSPHTLDELGLPAHVTDELRRFARADAGMLLVTGPAGSGKTTTLYALLSQIVRDCPGVSVVALEDPIERDLQGVTQIEVSTFGELTYERALRSMLRQDPQVLMLGEIRDAATATLAVQAALSGHRLVSTLHAATGAGAICRLLEMGVEPYQITSSLSCVVSQRLLRRCVQKNSSMGNSGGGGGTSGGGGYAGRIAIGQTFLLTAPVRQAILQRSDLQAISQAAEATPGHASLRSIAEHAVSLGLTDDAEVQRVLGPRDEKSDENSDMKSDIKSSSESET